MIVIHLLGGEDTYMKGSTITPKAITTTEHEGLADGHISSVCIESVYPTIVKLKKGKLQDDQTRTSVPLL